MSLGIELSLLVAFPIACLIVFAVHELGHYSFARLFGIHVQSFSLGYGKKIFSKTDKLGTEWSLKLFPVGGYIKLLGHVYASQETKENNCSNGLNVVFDKTFKNKPIYQRFIVVLAGPLMNFIFASLLLSMLYFFVGLPGLPPYVTGVSVGSSGQEAGFKPGDIILEYNEKKAVRFEEIGRVTKSASDKPIKFKLKRGEQVLEIEAAPRWVEYINIDGYYRSHGRMGVMARQMPIDLEAVIEVEGIVVNGNREKARELILNNIGDEFSVTLKNITSKNYSYIINPNIRYNEGLLSNSSTDYNLLYLGQRLQNDYINIGLGDAVFEGLYTTKTIASNLAFIFWDSVTGNLLNPDWNLLSQEASLPDKNILGNISVFVYITSVLSVTIGLINLFPVAWTDGGYLVLFLIETRFGLERAKVIKPYLSRAGIAALLAIMLFANLSDITQLIPEK